MLSGNATLRQSYGTAKKGDSGICLRERRAPYNLDVVFFLEKPFVMYRKMYTAPISTEENTCFVPFLEVLTDPELCWNIAAFLPVVEGVGGRIVSMTGGDRLTGHKAGGTAGSMHGENARCDP